MMLPLLAGALSAALLGPASSDSTTTARLASAPRAKAPALIADSIVVEKRLRRLTLFRGGAPVKRYAIALGRNPTGRKLQIGDNRTPEGIYFIEGRNTQSKFYRSLRISYPDQLDRLRAQSLGLQAGGDIMIHGLPTGRENLGSRHLISDWTEGCIAVTNQEIDEIWAAIPDGAPIEIKP